MIVVGRATMKEKRKRSRRLYRHIKVHYMLIIFALGAGIYIITHRPVRIPINTSGDDVLYYGYSNHNRNVDDPNEGMLMMYDPRTNRHHVVMPVPHSFKISPNGLIAYHNGDKNIIVSNIQDIGNPPQAIILTLSNKPQILSWSHDGRFLAYTVINSIGRNSIYIWNGEESIDITPDERLLTVDSRYYISSPLPMGLRGIAGWSTDGKLIFAAHYDPWSSSVDHELYIWDGEIIYNLSHNPDARDHFPSWSSDGQVAFLSTQDRQSSINIWDGKSFTNGKPDYTILTETIWETPYGLAWSPDNKFAYGRESEIYLWDGETSENVSQVYGYAPDFNQAGFLAFTSLNEYGTGYGYVHIRDKYNQTIEILKGGYSAWSKDGYLATCIGNNLVLFDGENVIAITSAERSSVGTWQSGQGVSCMTSA